MGGFTTGISDFGLGSLATEPDLVKREISILFGNPNQDLFNINQGAVAAAPPIGGSCSVSTGGTSAIVTDSVEIRASLSIQSEDSTANDQATTDFGNYTLQFAKSSSGITLIDNVSGEITTITGDPHVTENGQTFTFKDNTTFQLADGTDLTVKTVPAGNGQTLSDEVDLSKGSQSITVTGLAADDSNPLTISKGNDGWEMRAANASDPTIYEANGEWNTSSGAEVDQIYAIENL